MRQLIWSQLSRGPRKLRTEARGRTRTNTAEIRLTSDEQPHLAVAETRSCASDAGICLSVPSAITYTNWSLAVPSARLVDVQAIPVVGRSMTTESSLSESAGHFGLPNST
jgi:hypothetical protein